MFHRVIRATPEANSIQVAGAIRAHRLSSHHCNPELCQLVEREHLRQLHQALLGPRPLRDIRERLQLLLIQDPASTPRDRSNIHK